jgi:predicted DNA-binding transcriptional regulator AlpA
MELLNAAELARYLELSPTATEVLRKRGDFPSPVLDLGKYVYWRQTDILRWLTDIKISPHELLQLSEQFDDADSQRREHFFLEQDALRGTDDANLLGDGFSLDGPLVDDDDDAAAQWLKQFGDSEHERDFN